MDSLVVWLFLEFLTLPVWLPLLTLMVFHKCSRDGKCPICDKEF